MLPVWIALVVLPILGGAERFNCRGRILGAYYADAKSGCKAFHVCVRVAGGGIRDFRFFCPPGTLFHQEAQTCTDWGDDDPLACPADIYDGQFDLYKIGSGFDTKKLSSSGNRDEESEFGLQRAETGDRRLSQNNAASDLRAEHSSDFFSGQRDRGRDDPTPNDNAIQRQNAGSSRQSFRRLSTTRAPPTTTQYTTTQPPPPPEAPFNSPSYENSKRKLVRKRPYYASTPASPTTFYTQPSQSFPEQQQQNFNRRIPQNKQTAIPANAIPQNRQPIPPANNPLQNRQSLPPANSPQLNKQSLPPANIPQPNRQTLPPTNIPQQNRQTIQPANTPQQNRQTIPPANVPQQTRPTIPPVDVPPQYKDYKEEYVEVSRVTPKPSKSFQTNSSPAPFSQSSPASDFKKSLIELYNYDSQSTPGLNQANDRPFKVRNSYSVADVPREQDYLRTKNVNANRPAPTTVDYNPPSRGTTSAQPVSKKYNSVSYEPQNNNFISYSKQNYFTNPTTPPSTTSYTTTYRPDISNLNTVAYNTNIGFHTQQNSNYAESNEDDGQYRPPQGEDDGQYRPELYERELLSGAHSLNIAASGNRLPDDQKQKGKTQPPFKQVSQTAAPRPFRPAPTPTSPPTQRVPEQTYPTTFRPQTQPQPQSQRTFDYYQTYTTTSRPSEASVSPVSFNLDGETVRVRPTTTFAPRNPEPRQQTRAPATPPPQPPVSLQPTSSARPFFANPANIKEDNSYDYAYYDSDSGFSEFDQIEEFGKTKKKA